MGHEFTRALTFGQGCYTTMECGCGIPGQVRHGHAPAAARSGPMPVVAGRTVLDIPALGPTIGNIMSRTDRRRAKTRNPFSRYLAMAAFATLCVVGVSALVGWQQPLSIAVKPLAFVCAILVVAYTVFALRLGSIGLVSQRGQVYRYSRRKEPVLFFLVVLLYLALSLPTALYMGWLMIGR